MNGIEEHKSICEALTELYEKKNADYGESFHRSFEEYGMIMPMIRIEDKLNRVKSITKNGMIYVADESVIDTLMDLANYAIMTIMELKQENT